MRCKKAVQGSLGDAAREAEHARNMLQGTLLAARPSKAVVASMVVTHKLVMLSMAALTQMQKCTALGSTIVS